MRSLMYYTNIYCVRVCFLAHLHIYADIQTGIGENECIRSWRRRRRDHAPYPICSYDNMYSVPLDRPYLVSDDKAAAAAVNLRTVINYTPSVCRARTSPRVMVIRVPRRRIHIML